MLRYNLFRGGIDSANVREQRIPEIAGSMGKGIKEFKKNINEATRGIDPEAPRYEPRLTGAELDQQRRTSETVDEPARPEAKRLILNSRNERATGPSRGPRS